MNQLVKQIQNIFHNLINSVREINRKYAKPRIKLTKWVKVSLFLLRLYLLLLVGLLIFKFITIVQGH